jgi:lysozyme
LGCVRTLLDLNAVGYGETEGVGPSTTMTRAQAEADLQGRLAREYEPAINGLGVPLNQNQFDGLASFVWNTGPGSMQWDVGRYLRAREYTAAANALLEYVRAGGVVLQGLVNRRRAERALFLTPPPHPDPYHVFQDQVFHFERKHIAGIIKRHPVLGESFKGPTLGLHERNTVRHRDELVKDRKKNAHEIRVHALWLMLLRKRVWSVAHHPLDKHGHATWYLFARGTRWTELDKRTHGIN